MCFEMWIAIGVNIPNDDPAPKQKKSLFGDTLVGLEEARAG